MASQDWLPLLGNKVPILKSVSLKGSILRSCCGDVWRGHPAGGRGESIVIALWSAGQAF